MIEPEIRCARCRAELPLFAPDPFCACGGAPAYPRLEAPAAPGAGAPQNLWRWASVLPIAGREEPVSLGEGAVPLQPLALPGLPAGVRALRDDLQPTGSWKDRGSAALVTALKACGVERFVEDSSGNAALSLAAYARAAGLALKAFVPASATPLKRALVREEGAELVEVPGARAAATEALREEVARGAFWASHAGQWVFGAGAATGAFDIALALGRLPRLVVLPAGQGGYLAALARGFEALAEARGAAPPALVGVQSTACAPLARAFAADDAEARPASQPGASMAEGVLVAAPARDREALAAARASGGAIVALDDLALEAALRRLWHAGLHVEPTAALGVAWLLSDEGRARAEAEGDTVVVLTGHGIRRGRPLTPGLA